MTIKGLRWCIVSLVAVATVINYIDRNALAVMWPAISEDLGLDKNDYANIVVIFTFSYAIGQAAFGKIFDAIGTRLGFLMSIVIWSLSIAAHALARGFVSLTVVRLVMGFGEAGNWPGATKANAEWFPIKERALAQGIFNSGAAVGGIISAPLIAYSFGFLGWKGTFIFIALLGAVWIIPWMILYKSGPDTHPWLSEEEREYILSGQKVAELHGEDLHAPSWLEMMKYKESWSVILSRLFIDPVWWLFVAWLPIYLTDKFGFDIKQIGAFAWVPYVGALFGALFGGWLSGRLLKGGWSVNKTRKSVIVLGALIMLPALLLTAQAADPTYAMLLIACVLFGFQTSIGSIQTLPSDYFSGKSVGSLAGISGAAAVMSVMVVTKIVPIITVNSYVPFFLLGAAFVPLSVLAIFLLGGRIHPVKKKVELNPAKA